ncbi:hypothetical protein EON65_06405 [archaeon]|nr:MAG: hypothetical protein EON65_06405 [archaeon]
METLLVRLGETKSLFFLLDTAHEFFRFLVLTRHDVRDTKVGQHDGRHLEEVVLEAFDNGVVVSTFDMG